MTATPILVGSISLQVVATLLASRLIRVSGGKGPWVLIAGAVGLMTARRLITLSEVLRSDDAILSLGAELVALVISALMVVGLAQIRPLFDRARRADAIEAGLGQVLENSLSEFYIFAADNLRFLFVNKGAQQNLGYSRAELAAMTPVDLKRDFTEDGFRDLIDPVLVGEIPRLRFKTHHRRRDGSTYPVEVDIQRTRFKEEPALLATILDSSAQDDAERALGESEAHFRSLIEHSHDVATIVEEDGTISYLSPSYEWVLGRRVEDRVGRNALELIHPDDKAAVQAAFAVAAGGLESSPPVAYRVRHADGTWRTMEGTGRTHRLPNGRLRFVVNQRDVTERDTTLRKRPASKYSFFMRSASNF